MALINAERFTPLIANSMAVLTFAAVLLPSDGTFGGGAGAGDDEPRGQYAAGFVLNLGAPPRLRPSLVLSSYEATSWPSSGWSWRGRTPGGMWVLRIAGTAAGDGCVRCFFFLPAPQVAGRPATTADEPGAR